MPQPQTLPTTTPFYARPALLIAGGLGLAGVGLAAGLLLRSPAPAGDDRPAAGSAQSAARAERSTPAKSGTPTARDSADKPGKAGATASPTRAAEAPPLETQRTALCSTCGVVEGVRPVERKGEGSGVGAVAGGVVGAVVGNQMGGGSGKAAMTVLGAIGGGMAGNEIEKRNKTTTVYDVRVRMEDGTLRSFTSATAPAPGAPVTVTDQGFKVVQRPAEGSARVVRTGG